MEKERSIGVAKSLPNSCHTSIPGNDGLSNWNWHSPHPKEYTMEHLGVDYGEVPMISSKLGPSKCPPSEQWGKVIYIHVMEQYIALNMISNMGGK